MILRGVCTPLSAFCLLPREDAEVKATVESMAKPNALTLDFSFQNYKPKHFCLEMTLESYLGAAHMGKDSSHSIGQALLHCWDESHITFSRKGRAWKWKLLFGPEDSYYQWTISLSPIPKHIVVCWLQYCQAQRPSFDNVFLLFWNEKHSSASMIIKGKSLS